MTTTTSSCIAVVAGLALAGCNQVFGVSTTELYDAPPIDAPFRCPTSGKLAFKPLVTQYIFRQCQDYTLSHAANLGTAICYEDVVSVVSGPIDGELDETVVQLDSESGVLFLRPRLSADGDELWLTRYDGATVPASVSYEMFQRTASGWSPKGAAPLPITQYLEEVSVITSRAYGPRRLLYVDPATNTLREYRETPTAWEIVYTYEPNALGAPQVIAPWFAVDGLSMMFRSPTPDQSDALYFATRSTTDAPFTTVSQIEGAPIGIDPFIDENCSRLFVSGLGSIFYAQQL
jgi:hypothetical protein